MEGVLAIGEAVPQIAIAMAIVAAAMALYLFINKRKNGKPKSKSEPAELMHQINKLVSALTDKNGDPIPPCPLPDECDGRFAKIEKSLESHGSMHRKQFRAIGELKKGQNEILEFLTDKKSERPEPEYDIDAEDTGRHEAVEEED